VKNIVADENYIFFRKINSFGGINFSDSIIGNASGYKTLGGRGVKAKYSYSNLIRS
jgi:hypothetical protein